MDERTLKRIMQEVRSGKLSADQAVARLRTLPFEDLGFAKLDHHRAIRTGFPEVIYCEGKTTGQVLAIIARLAQAHGTVLATRVAPEVHQAIAHAFPKARYFAAARITLVGKSIARRGRSFALVITAGTADQPVAEEAAVTAETFGVKVERLYDVGVAGLHRLLGHTDKLFKAKVIIVVAGMEGALPSVVGGLVKAPVVAVPTSVGYGASFQGLAALLTMLNSCATGVAVVNIDNGFGAGYYAALLMGSMRGK